MFGLLLLLASEGVVDMDDLVLKLLCLGVGTGRIVGSSELVPEMPVASVFSSIEVNLQQGDFYVISLRVNLLYCYF